MTEKTSKMLDLSKQVLEKVSFDRKLFTKELIKAARWNSGTDRLMLKAWALATFGHMYGDVIREVFTTTLA
jgi:hypothetical protein